MSVREVALPGLRVRVEADADLFAMGVDARTWAEQLIAVLDDGKKLEDAAALALSGDEREALHAEVRGKLAVPPPFQVTVNQPDTHGHAVPLQQVTVVAPPLEEMGEPSDADLAAIEAEGDQPGENMPADMPAADEAPVETPEGVFLSGRVGEPAARLDCQVCGKRFDRVQARAGHERSHVKEPCARCGREFSKLGLPTHKEHCKGTRPARPAPARPPVDDTRAQAAMPAVGRVLVPEPSPVGPVGGAADGCRECGKWPRRPESDLCEKHHQLAERYAVGVRA
jgi:hypothetical protein